MKTINLNHEEFEELTENPFFESRSSTFYTYGDKELFKCFGKCPIDYLQNKEYVLSSLKYYREKIANIGLVLPNALVKENGHLRGFTMDYIADGICLDKKLSSEISANEKIAYLKRIGQILEVMKKIREEGLYNFFLTDIHEENILIDNSGRMYIVDVDSIEIFSSKPFSAKYLRNTSPINFYLNKYRWFYGLEWGEYYADYNTEIYCYIIMIMNLLLDMPSYKFTLSEYFRSIYFLNKLGVPQELTEIFKKVYDYGDNINPFELLDYLVPYLEDDGPTKVKKMLLNK